MVTRLAEMEKYYRTIYQPEGPVRSVAFRRKES
jgi:hypothetical protein